MPCRHRDHNHQYVHFAWFLRLSAITLRTIDFLFFDDPPPLCTFFAGVLPSGFEGGPPAEVRIFFSFSCPAREPVRLFQPRSIWSLPSFLDTAVYLLRAPFCAPSHLRLAFSYAFHVFCGAFVAILPPFELPS